MSFITMTGTTIEMKITFATPGAGVKTRFIRLKKFCWKFVRKTGYNFSTELITLSLSLTTIAIA